LFFWIGALYGAKGEARLKEGQAKIARREGVSKSDRLKSVLEEAKKRTSDHRKGRAKKKEKNLRRRAWMEGKETTQRKKG